MAKGTGKVLDAFRRWGTLQADLDPLRARKPPGRPELNLQGKEADRARRFYCGPIGVEFMHIPDPERRRWIQERMESEQAADTDRAWILERLIRADLFEQVLQSRYLGTKRFSLEGITAPIPPAPSFSVTR